MALPDAAVQAPLCGACGTELEYDGGLICNDCGLVYDSETLAASFLDPQAIPCNTPCGNSWHGDHKIRPGWGYQCSPCRLPDEHKSDHWTDCHPVRIPAATNA